MFKKILSIVTVALMIQSQSNACTSIIVTKGASKDGSVMTSYNCDSFGAFHPLYHFKPGKHAKGEMLKIYDRDTRVYHGVIAQVPETYNVIGNINEFQVAISETTFGGRLELMDSTGVLDYGSLMNVALQRSKTAREAINVMASLVAEYGYNSEGESFSVCDPNEAWIMEMIGKGPGNKGAVWVAIRIPDGAVSAHANQSRIRQFDQKDKNNVLFSKDVIKFAREKGYFKGKDKDFSFADAYCPAGFGELRYCEARVWAFFNMYAGGMDKYLPYAMGTNPKSEPMPLWIIPKRKLSVADVEVVLRDHYDGTPMDMNSDWGQGVYETPYRQTPLAFEYKGKKYFNERPISTQQTAFTWISQSRSWLPNEVGGVFWFGNDDGNMVAYTPVYCGNNDVPNCYKENEADAVTFSDKNAFWVCNWVSNMVYPRYSMLMPELAAVRDSLERSYFAAQPATETRALELYKTNAGSAIAYLTSYSNAKGEQMLAEWKKLATKLIVKYNDGVIHTEKDGKYEMNESGFRPNIVRPGYSEKVKEMLIESTGDRYLIPDQKRDE